jgi:hypothetical protein
LGGPVAQQGRAADWSYGTRLRLLTRRSGVQFPSGPPHHSRILTIIYGFFWLISCIATFNKQNAVCYKKKLLSVHGIEIIIFKKMGENKKKEGGGLP